jgi:hypothetical protein
MPPSEELGAESASSSDGPGSAGAGPTPSARQDFIGGVLALAFGAFMLAKALAYPMGSMLRMGPGFFPAALSALIIILGAALTLHGWRRAHSDREHSTAHSRVSENPGGMIGSCDNRSGSPLSRGRSDDWRPVVTISIAVVLFALMIERFGIAPATMALVLVSSLAGARVRPWRILIMAVTTTAAIYVIFILVLEMPLPVARW